MFDMWTIDVAEILPDWTFNTFHKITKSNKTQITIFGNGHGFFYFFGYNEYLQPWRSWLFTSILHVLYFKVNIYTVNIQTVEHQVLKVILQFLVNTRN
jgi:hypothetical protein